MKNERTISGLPTEDDFGGSLDAKSAWKNFGGLDLDSAYELFCTNPGYYQEDFMFMETAAFESYFPVMDRYLRQTKVNKDTVDVSDVWILGEAVLSQMTHPRRPLSQDLVGKIDRLCQYIRTHLSQYASSEGEQLVADSSWVKVEQKVIELKNRG